MESILTTLNIDPETFEAISYFSSELFLIFGIILNLIFFLFFKRKLNIKRISDFITSSIFILNSLIISAILIKSLFFVSEINYSTLNNLIIISKNELVIKLLISIFMFGFIISTYKLTRKARFKTPLINSLLLLITTPDEMANQIQTAKGEREQTIYELRTVDEQLPGSTASTKDISLLKTKLDGNLRTIRNLEQENLSIESTTDINSPESQEAIEQYTELKTKLQIIRSVDTKTFRKAFDFSDQVLPDFILETASKAVKTKLQSLVSKYPAAKHAENKEKISEHQKRADNIAKKIELQKALNAIEQKLSKLQERKSQIVKKFNNVNIDEAIERLQKEADEVMTKYSESFENFAYEYNGSAQN